MPCKDEEYRSKEAGPPGRSFLRKPINTCARTSTSGPATPQPIPCRVRQQGLQPTAPGYSGVSRPWRVLRIPGSGEVQRSLLTLLFPAGVSLLLGAKPVVGGCNPWPGGRVVRSTPGGTLFLEDPAKLTMGAPTAFRCRGSLLLEAEEPPPPGRVLLV